MENEQRWFPEGESDVHITQAQAEAIAVRAKEHVINYLHAEVGKAALRAILLVGGTSGFAYGLWHSFFKITP